MLRLSWSRFTGKLRSLGILPRRVLVIDVIIPQPDRDSGSLRMFRLLTILRSLRCIVTFIPQNGSSGGAYGEKLRTGGIRVLSTPAIPSILEHLKTEGTQYHAVILCRAPLAIRFLEDVRHFAPSARVVLDTVDLHHVRRAREAALTDIPSHRTAAEEAKRDELRVVRAVDCTLVVSEAERFLLRSLVPEAKVFTVSNIHITRGSSVPFDNRHGLLFIGNFRHPPNADAMRSFVGDILPLIHRSLPALPLTVIGQYGERILEGMDASHVRLLGHVPDISGHLAQAKVFIAPLRFGAGVKGKINTSMAHGLPVVTTAIGAEGMHLRHECSCLIADSPTAFAEAVLRLHGDRTLWERLATEALKISRRHFSPRTARRQCKAMFRHLDGL